MTMYSKKNFSKTDLPNIAPLATNLGSTLSIRVLFDCFGSMDTNKATGIKNIAVVLQNLETNIGVIVYTDYNGNANITNVPQGKYALAECFETYGGINTPADYSIDKKEVITVNPKDVVYGETEYYTLPIGFRVTGREIITSLTPNYIVIDIPNIQNNYDFVFIDTLISSVNWFAWTSDFKLGDNILISNYANSGDFGNINRSFPALTSPPNNPYPEILNYQGNIAKYAQYKNNIPNSGNISITNIINNNTSDTNYFNLSDFTKGDETGRMLIVAANPYMTFFRTSCRLKYYATYSISIWICILDKNPTSYPRIQVQAMSSDSSYQVIDLKPRLDSNLPFWDSKLPTLDLKTSKVPIWEELCGSYFCNSLDSMDFLFRNANLDSNNVKFAIDNITIKEYTETPSEPNFFINQLVDKSTVFPGDVLTYTIFYRNSGNTTLRYGRLSNTISSSIITTIEGSRILNGNSYTGYESEIYIGNIIPGDYFIYSFKVKVNETTTTPNSITCNSLLNFLYFNNDDIAINHSVSNNITTQIITQAAKCNLYVKILLNIPNSENTTVESYTIPNASVQLQKESGEKYQRTPNEEGIVIFDNISLGKYILSEHTLLSGKAFYGDPAINYVDFPNKIASGANKIISLSPNTIFITFTIPNGEYFVDFIDSPIREIPFQSSYIINEYNNLISDANSGTFNTFDEGVEAQKSPNINPYPSILSNTGNTVKYKQYGTDIPKLGSISISNIINNNNFNGKWWNTSDYTYGDERGAMEIVASKPNMNFFYISQKPFFEENSYYSISIWICLLDKKPISNPMLQATLSSNSKSLEVYLETPTIYKTSIPVWQELRGFFKVNVSDNYDILFKNVNTDEKGNNFAVDNIKISKFTNNIDILPLEVPFSISSDVNVNNAYPGDIITYTTTCTNNGTITTFLNEFTFEVPNNTTLITDSITINGFSYSYNHNLSIIPVNLILPEKSVVLSFSVKINENTPFDTTISYNGKFSYSFKDSTNNTQVKKIYSTPVTTKISTPIGATVSIKLSLSTSSAGDGSDYIPLSNIPFVLQDNNNLSIIVLTDKNGIAKIKNVPPNKYLLAECYETVGGKPSPVDFTLSKINTPIKPTLPPIDAIDFPNKLVSGATTITALSTNLFSIEIIDIDIIYNYEFINAPIKEIANNLTNIIIDNINLISDADSGTFGNASVTVIQNSPDTNPYPTLLSNADNNVNYQQYGLNHPSLGNISISNIIRNNNFNGKWWNISDHSTKNQDGRMEIIASRPNMAFFYTSLNNLEADTVYCISLWICILDKNPGDNKPKLQIKVSPSDAAVAVYLTPEIETAIIPVWQEIHGYFHTRQIQRTTTLLISNVNSNINGNNFAIDDIRLSKITNINKIQPEVTLNYNVDKSTAEPSDILTYTAICINNGPTISLSPILTFSIPSSITIYQDTITVNNYPLLGITLPSSIRINPLMSNETITVSFKAKVNEDIVRPSTISSLVYLNYKYINTENILVSLSKNSDLVKTTISYSATLSVRALFDCFGSMNINNATGIRNIAIVLHNLETNTGVIVYTDYNGNAKITNVPQGKYALAECFETYGGVNTPADYSIDKKEVITVNPKDVVYGETEYYTLPIGFRVTGTAIITSLTPNYIVIDIPNIQNNYDFVFIDTLISSVNWFVWTSNFKLGDNILPSNYANSGDFGNINRGFPALTSPPNNPYPEILNYQGNIAKYAQYKNNIPNSGNISITNIINNNTGDTNYFNLSDFTKGDETGRMLIVAANPYMTFFRTSCTLKYYATYSISIWICILDKKPTSYPRIQVQAMSSDSSYQVIDLKPRLDSNLPFWDSKLPTLDLKTSKVPIWEELCGSYFCNSLDSMDFLFRNANLDSNNVKFAIDNITIKEYTETSSEPNFFINQLVDKSTVFPGDVLTYTVFYRNSGNTTLRYGRLSNTISPSIITNIKGSSTLNDNSYTGDESSIYVGHIIPGDYFIYSFKVKVNETTTTPNSITCNSLLNFLYFNNDEIPINHSVSNNITTPIVGVKISVKVSLNIPNSEDTTIKSYPIPNWGVILTAEQESNNKVLVTNQDGIVTFDNISFGEYTISQYNLESKDIGYPSIYNVNFPNKIDSGANKISLLSPNTIYITITIPKGEYFYEFINTPIQEVPFNPGNIIEHLSNLITDANSGIFYTLNRGAKVQESPSLNPYPSILLSPGSTVNYIQYGNNTPTLGNISISNIINNNNFNGKWWNIADYTFGDERGTMEIVASKPNMNFFYVAEGISLDPTYFYFISLWICVLDKKTNSNPKIQVTMSSMSKTLEVYLTSTLLLKQTLPVWLEFRGFFKVPALDNYTLLFKNVNTDEKGNNFAVDNIKLSIFESKADSEPLNDPFSISNDVNFINARPNDILSYTITITNNDEFTIFPNDFTIEAPTGTTLILDSITINDFLVSYNDNIPINLILSKKSVVLSFKARIDKNIPVDSVISYNCNFTASFYDSSNNIETKTIFSTPVTTKIISSILNNGIITIRLVLSITSAADTSDYIPIANIPIILKNKVSNLGVTVLTDNDGNAEITNVPNGDYFLAECYGATGGTPATINFDSATNDILIEAKDPTIDDVNFQSKIISGANSITSLSPNIIAITVDNTTSNYSFEFIDAPVKNIPNEISSISITDLNLLLSVDSGTFGLATKDINNVISVQQSPISNPYADILSNPGNTTLYQQYEDNFPTLGNISISNIISNSNFEGKWWNIADHTSKDENGRIEIIASNPNMNFFYSTANNLEPNTVYCLSLWICILDKNPSTNKPKLQLEILPTDAILPVSLTPEIEAGIIPIWQEVGCLFHTRHIQGDITALLLSNVNSNIDGNNFAIDDIRLSTITITNTNPPNIILNYSVDKSTSEAGDILTYSASCINNGPSLAISPIFTFSIPPTFTVSQDTITVNDILISGVTLPSSIRLNPLMPKETATVSFKAMVNKDIIKPTIISSVAYLNYKYINSQNVEIPMSITSTTATTTIPAIAPPNATINIKLNLSLSSAGDGSDYVPIANVPFVFQDQISLLSVVVITDNNGIAKITNVPNGDYFLAECYGTTGGTTSTINFDSARDNIVLEAKDPTIDDVEKLISSLSPNLISITVTNPNLNYSFEFIDAPIKNIANELADITIAEANLLSSSDFGTAPKDINGITQIQQSPISNPYPDILSNLGNVVEYQQYTDNFPTLGHISVSNIIRNSNFEGKWWNLADHTTRSENGRMEIVASSPNMNFFYTPLDNLESNTVYCISLWVCILDKNPSNNKPKLKGRVSPSDAIDIYFTPEITTDSIPVWQQVRGFFQTAYTNQPITLLVNNINPNPNGNNFAVDDIILNQVTDKNIGNPFVQVSLSVDRLIASPGKTLTYTVILKNNGPTMALRPQLTSPIPLNTTFVENSIIINNVTGFSNENPVSIRFNPIIPKETITLSFKVKVNTTLPKPTSISCIAGLEYIHNEENNASPSLKISNINPFAYESTKINATSNPIITSVKPDDPDPLPTIEDKVAVIRSISKAKVCKGETFYYIVKIINNNNFPITQLTLTDFNQYISLELVRSHSSKELFHNNKKIFLNSLQPNECVIITFRGKLIVNTTNICISNICTLKYTSKDTDSTFKIIEKKI